VRRQVKLECSGCGVRCWCDARDVGKPCDLCHDDGYRPGGILTEIQALPFWQDPEEGAAA